MLVQLELQLIPNKVNYLHQLFLLNRNKLRPLKCIDIHMHTHLHIIYHRVQIVRHSTFYRLCAHNRITVLLFASNRNREWQFVDHHARRRYGVFSPHFVLLLLEKVELVVHLDGWMGV